MGRLAKLWIWLTVGVAVVGALIYLKQGRILDALLWLLGALLGIVIPGASD